MKIALTLLLTLFAVVAATAQENPAVAGTVTRNGRPVVVGVVLEKDGAEVRRTTTGTDGRYQFKGLATGRYAIVVDGVRRVFEADRLEINVDISLAGPAVYEKVTIAADTSQTFEEITKSVDVIGAQEMRDRADFALVESLRTVPGFRVQQSGGFGRAATIKTRGLRNQDTAVLIDGVRFRDASAITGDASAFLSDITLTSVSRVEVLRGAGSSLYGTNAIGGTIDLQTPKPENGWHGQASGAAGGLGLGRLRGNISNGTKRFGFNAAGAQTVYTKGVDGDDEARNTNFQSRVEFNPRESTNVSARFFVSRAFTRLNTSPDTNGVLPATNASVINAVPRVNFVADANDPDNFQKSRFFNGQLAASHVFNSKFLVRGYYSGLTTSRRNENGLLGVGFQSASTSIFDGKIHTGSVQGILTPNLANQTTFGAEFEREDFGNRGLTPSGTGNFLTNASQSSKTFYAQHLASLLGGSLQLAGGVRAQFFGLGRPTFSKSNAPYATVSLTDPDASVTFDGAVSYTLRKTGTKLRAHAGNGYRVPSLYERFGTFYSSFSSAFIALGDPSLRPETAFAMDGGVEQTFWDGKARAGATYFYTRINDAIGFGNVVPAIGSTSRPFGGYLNTRGGVSRGAEFEGRLKPARSTDLFASYTFTNSDQRAPQVTGNRNLKTLGVPDHQFTLVATQRFGRFWVSFDLLATSSYLAPVFSNTTFSTYVYRFDGNRRGDLTAGYTFPLRKDKLSLRVFGTAENMFDQEYYENGFRTAGANGRVGVALSF